MNNDLDQATAPDLKVGQVDSITSKRITRDKWLSVIFVSVLVLLCLAVSCCLYILSKDYLTWAANKHKAEDELMQLQAVSDKQRSSIAEELKRLELQKQERLNELAALKERTNKLNTQIAQREALLNSTDEEVKRLDKIKAEAKNLSAQNKQLTAEIDKQRQELSQLTGQNTVLTGQNTNLSAQLANSKRDLEAVQKQIAERNIVLAESEQANATVIAKQQQIARLQQQISALQHEVTTLTNKRLTASDETSLLLQKQVAVTAEIKSLESRLTALKADKTVLERSKSVLKQEISALQEAQNSATENLAKGRHQITEAELLKKQTTQTNESLLKTQNQLKAEVATLRIESGKLQGEISQLQIQHKKLVESIAELEKIITAKRNNGSASASSGK